LPVIGTELDFEVKLKLTARPTMNFSGRSITVNGAPWKALPVVINAFSDP